MLVRRVMKEGKRKLVDVLHVEDITYNSFDVELYLTSYLSFQSRLKQVKEGC